jgi:signal transduction histidine kinase/ligand-binding sensor domain-containing protein
MPPALLSRSVYRLVACCLVIAASTASAERLPVRVFTTADGLANNRVERGTQDTRGFIWFATGEGVSRFDSRRFESFGVADGIPGSQCHDVKATRDGRVWVAAEGGIAVLDPDERVVRPLFHALTADEAFTFTEDPSGVLWAGTTKGLTRFEHGVMTEIALPAGVLSIAFDPRDQSLWLGTFAGLIHRTRAGAIERFRVGPRSEPDDRTFITLIARDGTLWIGHVGPRILHVTLPLAPTTEPLSESSQVTVLPGAGGVRRHMLQDSTGAIWIGATRHLQRWNGTTLEDVLPAQIGSDGAPTPSLEDSAGNLWFGTDAQGVIRVARGGMVSYNPNDSVFAFIPDLDGSIYPVIVHDWHALARRDGEQFTEVTPKRPDGVWRGAWGYAQIAVIDRDRRLWYPTADGVLRYPPVARLEDYATTMPERITDLPGRDIARIYEDRRGDVWISTMSNIGLARWDRATDRVITLTDDWPKGLVTGFAEDPHGDLWIGMVDRIVRVHEGIATVTPTPFGDVGAILRDQRGRIWLASNGNGVARIDDPSRPGVVKRYRSAQIGSDQAISLGDDLQGRIYVGTSRGIARIDPDTDEIVHYGAAEGLPNDYVVAVVRARDGTLWFGTKGGMARLLPEPRASLPAARVYITKLAIAGIAQPLFPDGEEQLGPLELASDEGALDIELASPQFAIGSGVRFQYRLGGAWSAPTDEQALHFARLAPGRYDLEIRAVDAHNAVSSSATVAFRVLPPLWRRWWFLTLAALAVAGLAYAWYRRRLAHMLALERVRRRIASDLHDELGSSLSRISILSEVARRSEGAPDKLGDQLEVIGTSARELVDVASDIVWSTDPRRDDLQSLIIRLRSFAADIFDARGIGWSVKAPVDPEKIKLDPERRRHLYLVLKEAIANAAKHSSATRVDVSIGFEHSGLVARVRDNGKGFTEADLPGTGNGLANMRARAEEAGGTIEIRGDQGTEIVLRL